MKNKESKNSKEASTTYGQTPEHMLVAFKKLRNNIVDKQK